MECCVMNTYILSNLRYYIESSRSVSINLGDVFVFSAGATGALHAMAVTSVHKYIRGSNDHYN
jgi:hypothetical protein